MGKTTIGTMMKNMNIPVHESDHVVHQLLQRGSVARRAIAAAFPFFEHPEIYAKRTKDLKRKEFGDLIFNNDAHRATLESILHPLVQKSQNEFIRAETLKGRNIVCLDIPLLFEVDAQQRVDYTITVSAPAFVQRERALSRPAMTEEKLNAILERQMPDAKKCSLSDYVIKTGLGRAHAMKELKAILIDIREKSGYIIDPKTEDPEQEKALK
ncbi:MAG: dephospho-CoA kinase [Zetaproteobacteria bacterium]|nr:MAG: dephospho-CoA kinase [Zetaproteobacteria bacterium]